jgi:hypothetical protein
MKNYLVEVKSLLPYPKIKSFTLSCNSEGTAINRAIRLYRKAIGKKRIYSLTVKCDLLKGITLKGINTPEKSKNLTTDEKTGVKTIIEGNQKSTKMVFNQPKGEISFGISF